MRVVLIEEGKAGSWNELAGERVFGSALTELVLGHSSEPFVVMVNVGEEFFFGSLCKVIEAGRLECFLPRHAVKAAVGAVPAGGVVDVALLGVVPVDGVDCAIGPVFEIDCEILFIGCVKLVLAVAAGEVGGVTGGEDFTVELVPVKIVSKKVSPIFGRPVVTKVDHGSDVGMSSKDRTGSLFSGTAFAVTVGGDGVEVVKEGRVSAVPALFVGGDEAGIVRIVLGPAMTIAKDLADGAESPGTAAVGHEEGAIGAVVETPLVGATVGVDFEFMSDGVKTPDRSVDFQALLFRGSGLSYEGRVEDAMTAVEPTIVSPKKGVWSFVSVGKGKAVEENLGRAIGFVVSISVRNKNKLRSAGCEDATVSDLKSGNKVEIVGKGLASFEGSVLIGVFENDEAVFSFTFFLSAGVSKGLGDPDAPA